MKITFLGTGTSQGIPVIGCECPVCLSTNPKDKRLRTSVHIKVNGISLVIDTGPDFRQQILRENIKQLDAVIFTHQHKDHVAGLDDVRSFNFKQQKPMPVYANKATIEVIKREFYYAFEKNKYPGVPQIDLHEIDHRNFDIHNVTILPIKVYHHQLPVLGFRIQNFTYITDANFIPEKELEKIEGTEVLVLNALQKEEHISHFTLKQAVELSEKLQPKQTYLIHMSHNLGFHDEVMNELPENVQLAYDGLKVEL